MSADDRIRITCPKCHQKLRVKAAAAGKRARCPSAACGAVITIPSASASDPEPPRPQPRRPAEPFHFADASAPNPEPPRPRSHTRPWIWIAGGAVAVALVTGLALAIGLGGWLTRGGANKGPDAVDLRPGEVDDKTLTKDGPGAKQPAPQATADKPDDKTLPSDGPGDPALTYDEVSKNPAKHRGKRVTWPFVFCSAENETALGSLDAPAARRPGAYGMYLVKFSSTQEAGATVGSAFSSGSTITGTVSGEVETGLASRDRFGALLEKIPKARLPLLLYPVYK
jgi:hypothetical protein